MRFPAFLVMVVLASLARAEGITLEGSAQSVPRYARIEFTLRNVPAIDPHGDAAANIGVDILTPSGKRVFVPAFRYQPFEHRPAARGQQEWLYPTGEGRWLVRFAPVELGKHTATSRGGTATVNFEATASPSRGFIRVAKQNPRYFELDDGTPFFAVGQNIAFVKDSTRTIEMIQKFSAAGGNWARVWVCAEDWALAIEARRSAFARSWGWNVPIVAIPDREGYHGDRLCLKLAGEAGAKLDVSPMRGIPLKPAAKYRFTGAIRGDVAVNFDLLGPRSITAKGKGWETFAIEFTSGEQRFAPPFALRLASKGTAFLRDLSLKEAGASIELLPELDVNRPALGSYNEADAFLLDRLVEAAESAHVRLQLVLLTRDHYMALLSRPGSADYARATAAARNLVRYAAARWGYSTHVFAWEYFNELDPGKPTEAFYAALAEELDRVDVNRHLRTSSTWHSPSKEFASARLDVANLHHYLRPPDGDLFKDAPAAVRRKFEQSQKVMPPRPLMFAEYGIADPNYQRPRELDQDKELLHLRDGLWATMLGGWAGTASWWYWDDMHKLDAYRVYTPVAQFATGIPWNSGKLTAATASADQSLRVIGLTSGDGAWLWLSDPRATWHSVAVDGRKPEAITAAAVKIEKLTPGEYRVEWIEPATGKVVKEERVRSDGTVSLRAPDFTRDVAIRVGRAP